jgi:uncharacterized protein (TIGR02145 family)
MTKSIFTTMLMLCFIIVSGQEIYVTFSATGAADRIDSVRATNLKTNLHVTLPGNDTLRLNMNTGISDPSDPNRDGIVFPNPFSGKATFVASVQRSQTVSVKVYNISGQTATQTQAVVQPGKHAFSLTISKRGVYLVSLTTGESNESYKVICLETTEPENSIHYRGVFMESGPAPFLKSSSIYTLEYTVGDIILYRCMSGIYTTIVTDSPTQSKRYDVGFVPCTDPAGKSYAVVKAGTQTWMAENLAYLPSVDSAATGTDSLKHYYVYGYFGTNVNEAKVTANYATYGVLYNYLAAMNGLIKNRYAETGIRGACPTGWHMPADDEWKTLEKTLGMSQHDADTLYSRYSGEVGMKLKSSQEWQEDGSGSNYSGFTALPGGYRNTHGSFRSIDEYAIFWTASLSDTLVWFRSLNYGDSSVYRLPTLPSHGLSIRCVKD